MTRSTPARLYQLRSKRTISPAAGRCSTYRWKYHCVRCLSVGFGKATTRTVRGEVRSVIRLMTPPLPADPRPSKITSTFRPCVWIQYCSSTSCSCRRAISTSYAAALSLPDFVYAEEVLSPSIRPTSSAPSGGCAVMQSPCSPPASPVEGQRRRYHPSNATVHVAPSSLEDSHSCRTSAPPGSDTRVHVIRCRSAAGVPPS